MANCNYGCPDLPNHVAFACSTTKKGGSWSVGVLQCDHSITDFENNTQIEAAIAAGSLTIIKNIRFSYDDPAIIEQPKQNGCGVENELHGFTHTLTIEDTNVSATNNTFYEQLNQQNTNLIWYNCEEEEIRVVLQDVTWKARPANNPMRNNEQQFYPITAEWYSAPNEFPQLFPADPDIWQTF